jgi:predicted  nucleic acid-binding Zn-ribbon protein
MARSFVFALLASVVAGKDQTHLRAEPAVAVASKVPTSFIRSLDFKQTLRVCNAYPPNTPLNIWVGKEQINEDALQYKQCADFTPKLKDGSKLDFKALDSTVLGTFTISSLPQNDATLLMVIYRHDAVSTAVSFESHVFADSEQAQVTVIDTYRGQKASDVRILDKRDKKNTTEQLRYKSVVAVTPGIYEVELKDVASGATEALDSLVAVPNEAYVVVRCGIESPHGDFPQEVFVFPHSDPKYFSAASSWRPVGALVASLMALFSLH